MIEGTTTLALTTEELACTIGGILETNIQPLAVLTLVGNIANPVAGVADAFINGLDFTYESDAEGTAIGVQIGSVTVGIAIDTTLDGGVIAVYPTPMDDE
jgi:hypothetical protein